MADDTPTVEQLRQTVIGAVLSYGDALSDDLPPSNKAMALKAVADAFDALIAAVRAENTQEPLTQFSDDSQADLLELMRFVRYDKHTLLKALTFLRDQSKSG